jgi:hypothetical protein
VRFQDLLVHGGHQPVVAEPAHRPLEQLPPVQVTPQVGLDRAGLSGQRQELTQITLVEPGQRIGLQP